MSVTTFEAQPFKIDDWTIIVLPQEISHQLTSRGMGMAKVVINKTFFEVPLEPDGSGSHWFRLDDNICRENIGESVEVKLEPLQDWPKPEVPQDFKKALMDNPKPGELWSKITPNAQWEWIRWIRATKNEDTRKRRIEVAISKMKKGEKRPCCFNRNMCTEPYVSKNGVLLDLKQTATTQY